MIVLYPRGEMFAGSRCGSRNKRNRPARSLQRVEVEPRCVGCWNCWPKSLGQLASHSEAAAHNVDAVKLGLPLGTVFPREQMRGILRAKGIRSKR
jgi:hypothetical protein